MHKWTTKVLTVLAAAAMLASPVACTGHRATVMEAPEKHDLQGLVQHGVTLYEQGQMDQARRLLTRAVDRYMSENHRPNTVEATATARAQFHLAEMELAAWESLKLQGSLGRQERILTDKLNGAQQLRTLYEKIYKYQDIHWILAARFRQGHIMQHFAQTLRDADIPFEPGTQEHQVYQNTLIDIAIPLEDEAAGTYREVIKAAHMSDIKDSPWVARARIQLSGLE